MLIILNLNFKEAKLERLILIISLLLISVVAFSQETVTTKELFGKEVKVKSVNSEFGRELKELGRILDFSKIVLKSLKDSKLTYQISDILTDLYSQMYKDLVKKGLSEDQAFKLMTMTFEQAEKIIKEIAEME